MADIPCVDVGGPNKPNYVPIELCSLIPLQKYTRSTSASQRSSLAAQSRSPAESMKALTDLKFGPRKKPSMDRPTNGQWNYDGKRLVIPVKIENWCVVDFSSGYNSRSMCKR